MHVRRVRVVCSLPRICAAAAIFATALGASPPGAQAASAEGRLLASESGDWNEQMDWWLEQVLLKMRRTPRTGQQSVSESLAEMRELYYADGTPHLHEEELAAFLEALAALRQLLGSPPADFPRERAEAGLAVVEAMLTDIGDGGDKE